MLRLPSKRSLIRSFKYCGITSATDGREDDLITCFHSPDLMESREELRQLRLDAIEALEVLRTQETKSSPVCLRVIMRWRSSQRTDMPTIEAEEEV